MAIIGFIGLGAMGAPMAGHLVAAGHTVRVHDPDAGRMRLLEDRGATGAPTAATAAAGAQILFTMLPSKTEVGEALFGACGAAAALRASALVIDTSSIAPDAAIEYGQRLVDRQVGFLDAPVSGGPAGATAATLSIMVGASAADYDRARPVLADLGRTIVHVGPIGAGQVAKCCNQIAFDVAIQGVAEALHFARAHGVDCGKVRDVLLGGLAASKALEVVGAKIVARDFAAGMESRLHHKDIGVVMEVARQKHLALPATAAVMQQLNALMALGMHRDDPASLVRVLERLVGMQEP